MSERIDINMVHSGCLEIARQLYTWKPDIIVGITPNNMMAAKYLSTFLQVPLVTLTVNLDYNDTTSDCELAEQAIGYDPNTTHKFSKKNKKNILVMVDYNKNNEVFLWIEKDWKSGCFPTHERWGSVFGTSVRFAALVENTYNIKPVDYSGFEMGDSNIIFPWDAWWK